MSISAWAASKARSPLTAFRYEPAPLGPRDVEIRISHCGICHSDLHLINDDWGVSRYPLVPGHEIVGTVTGLGSGVSHLKVGQRVGVGWQRSACGECEYCRRGDDNLCAKTEATCVGHHGGFAAAIVTDGRFAFPIPDALESALAAPLLCAGVTVFSPLARHGVGPGMRVGIVGIGGLGHIAVQFAAKLGAAVMALSSTAAKAEDAHRLGAAEFLDTSDSGALQKARRSLDYILSTVNVDLPWGEYLKLLRPNGTLCFVGATPGNLGIRPGELLSGQRTLTGSTIGGRRSMTEMLSFAAEHQVRPRIEAMPMGEVNTALQRVAANQARFRMVLENP
ncbi:MAG: NAD(P)-dependent alcohol dehydrogenase [Bacillota bacterium]